jgi:hypothetical protein
MYNKSKTVIVYLAMNTTKDTVYSRNSIQLLKKSLDLLYLNYNNKFKHDIIIFYDHNFPFSVEEQIEIINKRSEIKFRCIDNKLWCPPDCDELRQKTDINLWKDPKFSIGYRNMMRWYGILIYKYLYSLGYEMYMRMDDDSFILSEINYDMFKFLYENNYEYAFRAYCNDYHGSCIDLIEYTYKYINKFKIKKYWIDRFINKFNPLSYNRLGYYNNFMITKLDFWMRQDVQNFLNYIDQSGFMYTKRWGDLMIQSISVQIFMNRNSVYHFNDWKYEHATFQNFDTQYKLVWGGLYPKIEKDSYVLDEYDIKWYNKYKKFSINTFQTLSTNQIVSEKISININHNTSDYLCIGVTDNIIDAKNIIYDFCLNCFFNTNILRSFVYKKPLYFLWLQDDYKLYAVYNENKKKSEEKYICHKFILNKNIIIPPEKKYI